MLLKTSGQFNRKGGLCLSPCSTQWCPTELSPPSPCILYCVPQSWTQCPNTVIGDNCSPWPTAVSTAQGAGVLHCCQVTLWPMSAHIYSCWCTVKFEMISQEKKKNLEEKYAQECFIPSENQGAVSPWWYHPLSSHLQELRQFPLNICVIFQPSV